MPVTAGEIASRLGLELQGDPNVRLRHVATIEKAAPGDLTFLNNPGYLACLRDTGASTVILKPEHAAQCPATVLLADDPYLAYARAARILFPDSPGAAGVHPSAVIGEGCRIDATASIAPQVVLGDRVTLAEGVTIGSGCVVGDGVTIGAHTVLNCENVSKK